MAIRISTIDGWKYNNNGIYTCESFGISGGRGNFRVENDNLIVTFANEDGVEQDFKVVLTAENTQFADGHLKYEFSMNNFCEACKTTPYARESVKVITMLKGMSHNGVAIGGSKSSYYTPNTAVGFIPIDEHVIVTKSIWDDGGCVLSPSGVYTLSKFQELVAAHISSWEAFEA